MKNVIIVATTMLSLTGGFAYAQTSTESTTSTQTTTAVPPPIVAPMPPPTKLAPPPAGALATESYSRKTDAYGNSEVAKTSTYRDSNGVAQDSQTTRTSVPVPPPVVSTTTSSSSTTTGIPQ